MCGRYTLVVDGGELWAQLGLEGEPEEVRPRYNLAPTQEAPIVGLRPGALKPRLVPMRWGLVPSFSEDASAGARMINARSETAAEKPSFRSALASRRCLVPATGFYEWKTEGKKKQPYLISLPDEKIFTFAGLWERWRRPGEERLFSFTILATSAVPALASVHHRMPVLVPPAARSQWLDSACHDSDTQGADALARLVAEPRTSYTLTPVSSHVSNARNDDPACLEPSP